MNAIKQFMAHRYVRLGLMLVAVAFCLFSIKSAATYGLSQFLGTYSMVNGSTGAASAASTAAQISPDDAEAHLANGALLSLNGKHDEALKEFERAVVLRPSDFRLWSELGLLRDQRGDESGALAAFNEAVARAPHYSQPRWNRGNVLLRSGQYEAAFHDLNRAAESNPALLPNLMALAWGLARGDVHLAEQLARVTSNQRRIAFTRFLALRGEGQPALAQYKQASGISQETRNEFVEQLLAKGAVKEAFEIWKDGRENQETGYIYDGGFESPLTFGERNFGWRVSRDLQNVTISVGADKPNSGSKDLRIEFNGNSDSAATLVAQLVIVQPSTRYKINFAARSEGIVSGALPVVLAVDNSNSKLLGKSTPLANGTTEWQHYSFDFTTSPQTSAIVLNLQREGCTTPPCPIFGAVSLDSFSLEQLK